MTPETPDARDVRADAPVDFGKYVLERRIAVGGTSEVYLARLKVSGREGDLLVIKRLLPAFLVDPAALGMFATEARLHRAVSHPNVVRVYEAGVVEGEPYLAMEYIDGVDAAHLLRRAQVEQRTFPIGLAIYVARAICDALYSVHSAKDPTGAPLAVMHRDVTPSNLYLSAKGDVRLGDFGIARTGAGRPSRASMGAGIKGKYGYLSPEQVCGESCDHRSDLFSLAVVICEMVLGRPLFPGSGQLAVLLAIRDGRIDALRAAQASLPAGLFDVLAKALSREPAARYSSALELSDALAPFETPSRAELVTELASWVAWARDAGALARRLQGAIRESGERLVRVRVPDEDDDIPTTPRAGGSAPAVAPDEAKTLLRAKRSSDPPTVPRGGQEPRTLPRVPSTSAASAAFRDDEPPTARFDERPSFIRFAGGEEIGPIAFARIIEMIVTGQLGSDDQVDLMGQGLRRVALIDLLERHLPDAATTRSVRTPGPPDATFELSAKPLLAILGQLGRDEESGFLLIEGKPPGESSYSRREVYLKLGTLHHVGTSDVSELLGQSLVRRGMISNAELDMALAVLSKFEGRLGDTLVALGLLDAMDLFRAIEEQGKERLARVFGWSEGRATFYRGVLPARVEFPLELELADLMLAGLEVAQPSDAPVTMFQDHLGKRLRRTKRTGSPKRRSVLPKPVVLFLDTVGGGMELRQVMMRLSTTGALSASEALRAMQVAIALGLVEAS